MKRERDPVDDFFKEALQKHQVKPSDAARQRFLDVAATIPMKGRRSWLGWFLLFAGLTVVGTTAILIWWGNSPDSNEQSAVSNQQPTVGKEQSAIDSRQSKVGHVQPEVSRGNSLTEVVSLLPVSSPDTNLNAVPKTVANPESIIVPENPSVPSPVSVSNPGLDRAESSSLNLPQEDTISKTKPISILEKPDKRKKVTDWQFATSVYYAPEWMFNTLEGDKFVSNFGIEESFHYGRYLLRTGVGLSVAKGTNELMIEYNDYLGSYNQLDSISFAWDEKNYHLLPTYYLSNKDIWDSLLKLDYPKIIKRYTYIQIPLILGYDLIRKNRFSLGFRAGPILSVLMNSKTLTNDYDLGKNRIIRINQVTPDRIQTNWQIQGGINLSLHISNRFSLELEPTVKYYFNSVYEKSDATKKPWSVGFRASFTIFH